jgi:hypothetical protein
MLTATRQRRPLLRAGIALAAMALVAGCGGGGGGGTKSISSIRSCVTKKHMTTSTVPLTGRRFHIVGSMFVVAPGRDRVRVDVFSKAKDAKDDYRDLKAIFGGSGAKIHDKTVLALAFGVSAATLKTIERCAF